MDWNAIKAEYIAGGTSYRKLAEKYNVPFGTLRKWAAKEKWTELRDKTRAKADTKMANIISAKQANRYKRLQDVADKLLDKLEGIVENVILEEMILDKYTMKQITGALKDIKDIQSLKSPLDLEEQHARIAKLKKEAEGDATGPQDITVIIKGDADDYSK